MKLLLMILISCSGTMVNPEISQLRSSFFESSDDKAIGRFYKLTSDIDNSDPLMSAYKGASTAMYAQVVNSPIDKLKHFYDGRDLLENAVKVDSRNVEIRFLRFALQSKAPFFVGYKSKIREDVAMIVLAFETKTINAKSDFWKKAANFMFESGKMTQAQKTIVDKSLKS